MPRIPQYRIESYTCHNITTKGNKKIDVWIAEQERSRWPTIQDNLSTSDMVEELHRLFEMAMDESYERKTRKKKNIETGVDG